YGDFPYGIVSGCRDYAICVRRAGQAAQRIVGVHGNVPAAVGARRPSPFKIVSRRLPSPVRIRGPDESAEVVIVVKRLPAELVDRGALLTDLVIDGRDS